MTDAIARTLLTIIAVAAATGYATLGVVAHMRGPRKAYLKIWVVYCAVVAVHMPLIAAANYAHSVSQAELLIRLAMGIGALEQVLLVLFALGFARPVRGERAVAGVTMVLGAAGALLAWLTPLVVAGAARSDYSQFAPVAGPLMPALTLYVAFTWACPFLVFLSLRRRSTGIRRTHAAYLMLALGFGLIGSIGFMLPSALQSHSVWLFLPALLLPLFPLTITYTIVRHRLWDIRTVVHRTAVWAVLSAGLVVPLYVILRRWEAIELALGPAERAALLLAMFLLAHLYLRAMQPKLNHWFQRRAYDRRTVLDRFTRDMSALSQPDAVAGQILDTLAQALYSDRASICFRSDHNNPWRWRSEPDATVAPDVAAFDEATETIFRVGLALDRNQLGVDPSFEDGRAEAQRYFDAVGAEVCMPLLRGGEHLAMVHVGPRTSLKPYTAEDLELLELLGAAATTGLSNALLFERVLEQRHDLERLTAGLEDRVAERTNALEDVNRKLSRANEELKALDQLKNRFFANISHELKTPLTLILGPVRAMQADGLGSFDEGQREHLGGIEASALELLKLIDDLLDLSRLEESRIRVRLDDLDLYGLVDRVVDFARPLAQRKRIEMTVADESRPVVQADEAKLERVLVNLLTNALKFTEPGGSVTVHLGEEGDRASFAVEDMGIGIPEAEIGRIFDRFHQVDSPETRNRGGTGIGLALAKELVELHDGALTAASAPGEGATFTVELPKSGPELSDDRIDRRVRNVTVANKRREEDRGLADIDAQIRARPEYRFLGIAAATERRLVPRRPPPGVKTARLLVADDNTSMLKYLQQVLGEQYELWLAQDGEQAWELLREHQHDLVVSDVMMPRLSGLELCQRIKRDPKTQDTPVILLTARGEVAHRIDGHEVGADEYLAKPFEPLELSAAIEGLLTARTRQSEVAARRRARSLETLLGGMAHELRNAAHQIRSAHTVHSKLTDRLLGPEEPSDRGEMADRFLAMEGVSQRALTRITKVVHNLQRYAQRGLEPSWEQLDFDALVRSEASTVGGADDEQVRIELDLQSGARLKGPGEELRHLVLNLVENAVQAVAPAGAVQVRTVALSGAVQLTVTDDGCGMPPEVLSQAFDPFFTTKPPGRGMGLGLALCKRTVDDVGGTITIDTRESSGTQVTVELPTTGTRTRTTPPSKHPP